MTQAQREASPQRRGRAGTRRLLSTRYSRSTPGALSAARSVSGGWASPSRQRSSPSGRSKAGRRVARVSCGEAATHRSPMRTFRYAGPRRAGGLVVRLCLPASRALAQPRPRSSPSHLRRLACCSAGYRRAQAKATVNGARSVAERASTIRVPTHRRARSAPDAAAARHRNGAINVERLPPSASAMASLERRPQPLSQSARGTSRSRRARRAYS
jgi:hypothetical protein